MANGKKSLFDPVVPDEKLCDAFKLIASQDASGPTRWMVDRITDDFVDPDGNFAEQFQTTGFDARVLELYMFAYFSRSGFEVDRKQSAPDFLVSRGGVTVAVETTTVNRSTSGVLATAGRTIDDLDHDALADYERDELPIRFGSPLFSKLKKRYWQLPHCQDRPFVIVIETFHDQRALGLSDHPLSAYLYGQRHKAGWSATGKLVIDLEQVDEHKFAEKVVPSGFFSLEEAENVSAVVFTNSGTISKFTRMGYQHGIGNDENNIIRRGFFYNPLPDARDSTFFSYNLDDPDVIETWGQGLVVCHNPFAKHPISREFFRDAIDTYVDDGRVITEGRTWHPFSSQTFNMYLGETKAELLKLTRYRGPNFAIEAISKDEFSSVVGEIEYGEASQEEGWFADSLRGFYGVIYQVLANGEWRAAVFARNEWFNFESIATQGELGSREDARLELMTKIAALVQSPQRIFLDA